MPGHPGPAFGRPECKLDAGHPRLCVPKSWMAGIKPARTGGSVKLESSKPPLDFQDHLARLEAQGLLRRIDRPVNKDTELHPLVRWQFQGGLHEDERRAFLFTNVVDSVGWQYDTAGARSGE